MATSEAADDAVRKFNGSTLGPGILTTTYGTLFEDYVFSGIYGWGSDTDPDAVCTYSDGSEPPNPGWTYSTLVARTGGVPGRIVRLELDDMAVRLEREIVARNETRRVRKLSPDFRDLRFVAQNALQDSNRVRVPVIRFQHQRVPVPFDGLHLVLRIHQAVDAIAGVGIEVRRQTFELGT